MSMTNKEAIVLAFKQINNFKRHRVLAEQARQDGDTQSAIFNELKSYKAIDSLELAIRVLNKNERTYDEEDESSTITTVKRFSEMK